MEVKFGANDKPCAFTRHGWVKRATVNVLFFLFCLFVCLFVCLFLFLFCCCCCCCCCFVLFCLMSRNEPK